MAVNTRFIFWLIKAYLAKSGKIIILSFIIGLIIFFGLLKTAQKYSNLITFHKVKTTGLVGAYTTDNLPPTIVNRLSRGLTKVTENGTVLPDIAASWKIENDGKTYVFTLKDNVYFNDGQKVTSDTISYNFSDVTVAKPDTHTIAFTLEDKYAPFLVTVSRPIFKKDNIGVGDYKIDNNHLELNGNFISKLRITSSKSNLRYEEYKFYSTEDALKTAFALGEVTQAEGLTDEKIMNTTFHTFPTVKVRKDINTDKLVTLFYNTQDNVLSDKKLRDGLSYAIPDTFKHGERSFLPYFRNNIFYNKTLDGRRQDLTHAQLLIQASQSKTNHALTLKVLNKYYDAALLITDAWKKLGFNVKIEKVDSIPGDFQMYLGDFNLSKDPDQYVLWHSDQKATNISKYSNLRIDRLLEVGRTSPDLNTRIKTYDDFQKYLLDDPPASFLYFPYEYTLIRK